MSEITRYDREMLEEYANTKKQVEEKEQQVQDERAVILKLQDQSTEQQEQIQELYEATYNEIQNYARSWKGRKGSRTPACQIQQQADSLNQLLVQAKRKK